MHKGRLEAFSDGVIAIIITIMVLELKIPHEGTLQALVPILPVFLGYTLSFVFVGIYWNNHHHLLQTANHVNGRILWANMHLLFWLSLVPFVTGWMGENHFQAWPVALYGVDLLLCGFAYSLLAKSLVKHHGADSVLAKVTGKDLKGTISLVAYVIAIPAAFLSVWISGGFYVLVAVMWLIPDRRIEKALAEVKELKL
jgi:uncharacterized membrane protein